MTAPRGHALEGKVALVAGGNPRRRARDRRRARRGRRARLGHRAHAPGTTAPSTDRPETIEETAELVTAAGGPAHRGRRRPPGAGPGRASWWRASSASPGRLDVLVNDIWGGEQLFDWTATLWEHDLDNGLRLLRLAVETHLITSHYALPLLIRRPGGLVVEMTDGTAEYNAANYRVSAVLRPGQDRGAAAGLEPGPRAGPVRRAPRSR